MARSRKEKVKSKKSVKKTPKRKTAVKKTSKRKAVNKAKPASQNKPEVRTQKVWHIVRFEVWFELSEDTRVCRKGPLVFVKEYVSGKDDEGIKYLLLLEKLRLSPNRHVLQSVLVDIKRKAANRSRTFRGYLVNEKDDPATDKDIGGWVGLSPVACKKTLKELADIGFIERVPVPEWDFSKNEDPPKKGGNSEQSGAARSSPEHSGAARSSPEHSGVVRSSLKETETGNGNGKPQGKKQKRNPNPENQNQPKTEAELQYRKQMILEQLRQGKDNKNPPDPGHHPSVPDTDSDSGSPSESDAREGKQQASGLSNPPSSIADSDIDRYLDSVLNVDTGSYSQAAKDFGCLIYIELKVPFEPTSPDGRAELANFAKAWDKAVGSGLPPAVLNELWTKAAADARRIGDKRHKTKFRKNAQATWRDLFNRRLRARVRRIQESKPP